MEFTQPVANKYLGVLSDLRIVQRELPVTEGRPLKSKKGLYRITDEFFQFWFRFIFPRRGELEMGRTDDVLSDMKKEMRQYLSSVYEKVAIELLLKSMDRFFPFTTVGRWWERNEEIDIVGINPDLNSILFCEVKWSERPIGTDVYEALKQKASHVIWGNKNRKEFFCLFSRKGFTDAMVKTARNEGVVLCTGETIRS